MFMFSKLYVGEKDFSTEECRPTGFRACNARPESRGAARLSLGSAPACLLFHDVFEAEFFAGLLQTRYAIVPRLLEPQLAGISTLALGLEGYEEIKNADGLVYYRQGWWCRVR